jgi:hypothetical protein
MDDLFVKAPQPTLKRVADLNGADFYPTPEWATYALIENEKFSGNIWECACGDGAMSKVLKKSNFEVSSSDLFDRGFGDVGVDFLASNRTVDNIITNPPYNAAESFVQKAVECTTNKFALLLRLAFLESAKRQSTIFSKFPPSKVWVFSERITFYPKDAVRKGSGTTAYAWFVWDKAHKGSTELGWLPTGYKSRKFT